MADYYTQTVITDTFLLTEEMRDALDARGAEVYAEGPGETILDGLVNERPPLREHSIAFQEGWSDLVESYGSVDEWIEDEGHDPEDWNDEAKRLLWLDKEDFLLEILKVNPDKDQIEMQSAWSCNKMRLDGFGGSGLIVTRKGYLYLTSTHYQVDEDGTIKHAGGFQAWADEQDAADDQAA